MTFEEFLRARLAEEKRPEAAIMDQLQPEALRRIATLYARHPDYQPEWGEQ